ncbi:hypothetical protein RhiJN_15911 [Ceratobasidium sp. AG-Ba]|nr:hypothetical protein RhiJN_15911 [Ceratobasidium sp. AG-Ba]
MTADTHTATRSHEQPPQQTWTPPTGLPTLVGQTPQRPGLSHLLIFTGLFVPLVFLPYIPLRRHLLNQTRQVEALRHQLATQLSVTKENSRKLAATIKENHALGQQVVGLREELAKIGAGVGALREVEKEKIGQEEAQREWNSKMLTAIEKMQKDTKVLTPETFAQLSESLAHLAAFVELEERKNGFHQHGDDDSRGVGVMRALAKRLLEVSGMEGTTEEPVKPKYEHPSPPPTQPEPQAQAENPAEPRVHHQPQPRKVKIDPTQPEKKVERWEIPLRREERTDEVTWMW